MPDHLCMCVCVCVRVCVCVCVCASVSLSLEEDVLLFVVQLLSVSDSLRPHGLQQPSVTLFVQWPPSFSLLLFFFKPTIAVSKDCHFEVPQTKFRKQQKFVLMVVEARSPKSRFGQGSCLWEALWEKPFTSL